jgi:diketogulonate reductase-like aldo/keto reductase
MVPMTRGTSVLTNAVNDREYPGSSRLASNLHVATKFAAYPWRVTPGNIMAACRGSLRRVGLEQISLGQLHWSAAKYAPLQVGLGSEGRACTEYHLLAGMLLLAAESSLMLISQLQIAIPTFAD